MSDTITSVYLYLSSLVPLSARTSVYFLPHLRPRESMLKFRRKKSKKSKSNGANVVPLQAGSFPYHPEEEFIDRVSQKFCSGQPPLVAT